MSDETDNRNRGQCGVMNFSDLMIYSCKAVKDLGDITAVSQEWFLSMSPLMHV